MSAHRLDEHPGEVKVALRRRCEERRDLPGESRSVLAEDSSEGAEETRAILLEDSPCPWAGAGGRAELTWCTLTASTAAPFSSRC